MIRTLANFSPDEYEQMIGMWCYIFDLETEPDIPVGEGIIAGYRESNDGRTVVIVDYPDGEKWEHELSNISPRPDKS